MSPEQADPSLHDIDTRTDVYSLGVVLYELLTGFLPFDTTQWNRQRLDEVLRQLRETDPERPSTKVGANRATSRARDEARGTETEAQLVNALRGDLDWITLKALEKDRERRYGTPSALAADIERYLQHLPVEARPASPMYRLRKYVRRNRVAVAVGSGAAVLLIAFAVMQGVQLRRITRERDRADRITQFMSSMFKVSDPSEARGNSITAREILDKSSKEIDTGLARPRAKGADAVRDGDCVSRPWAVFTRRVFIGTGDLRRGSLGAEHPDTLRLRGQLGSVLTAQGRYAEAEKMDRDVLKIERRVLGPEHRDTLVAERDFFWLVSAEGHPADAEKPGRETFDLQRRILGEEDPDTLLTMRQLGSVMERADHLQDAEALTRPIIEIRKRTSGQDDPQTLLAMSDLGRILNQENRAPEAEAVYRPTLDRQRRVLGPDHPNLVPTMDGLAMALRRQHKLDEAEKLCRGPRHRQPDSGP